MFVEIFANAQRNDHRALLELIDRFKPLLNKYARKLCYEDAYDDLLLHFIETVHAIDITSFRIYCDATIVKYLSKSIYTYYIKLSKRSFLRKDTVSLSQLEDWQIQHYEKKISDSASLPIPLMLHTIDIEKLLTDNEFVIIRLIYEQGYSDVEIANIYAKSRQAVSQTKRRALKKLEKYYQENERIRRVKK